MFYTIIRFQEFMQWCLPMTGRSTRVLSNMHVRDVSFWHLFCVCSARCTFYSFIPVLFFREALYQVLHDLVSIAYPNRRTAPLERTEPKMRAHAK